MKKEEILVENLAAELILPSSDYQGIFLSGKMLVVGQKRVGRIDLQKLKNELRRIVAESIEEEQ